MEPNAVLHMNFKEKSDGVSYISRQYYKLPLQVFPANYIDVDGSAFVYMLNPSSGMLEGDLFDIKINLEDKAKVILTTPSSNKIYRSNGKKAFQQVEASIGEGCILEYIPEHNVPYENSIFEQKNIFHIERGGMLFMWDSVVPGRILRGECFDFTFFKSTNQLFYDNRLLLLDQMKICPDEMEYHNVALLDKFDIFINGFLVGENIPKELAGDINDYLANCKGVNGGESSDINGAASLVDNNLMVIKILFEKSINLRDIQWEVWNIIRKHMLNKPAFHIRKY